MDSVAMGGNAFGGDDQFGGFTYQEPSGGLEVAADDELL